MFDSALMLDGDFETYKYIVIISANLLICGLIQNSPDLHLAWSHIYLSCDFSPFFRGREHSSRVSLI